MSKRKIDGLTENEFDTLTLVKGLVEHGWSYNKVGKVIGKSHTTVKSMYDKALKLDEEGKLAKNGVCERRVQLIPVGGSAELEAIEMSEIDRQMGRRPKYHTEDQ